MEMTSEVKGLYHRLITELKKFGDILVEEKKTSIHLKNRAAFAGIHPRKNYFMLTIVSSMPITSTRVVKREQVSKSRYHNEFRIEKSEDIDNELLVWLKDAYELMK